MNKRTIAPIIAFACAMVIAVSATLVFLRPALSAPVIDGSWVILYNANDQWDTYSAMWIQNTYGGALNNINNKTLDFNVFGQNILIIGGSKSLAEQAGQWIGLDPTWYSIKRPDTYPAGEVYLRPHGATQMYPIHLVTPKSDYVCGDTHDYGMIIKGYDYTLRRWIVVCIGYSYYCTAYGAKLVCTQWETIVSPKYVVYQCTAHGINNPATWTFDQFDGQIIEQGD